MSFFFIDDALTEQTPAVRGVATSSATSGTTAAISTPAANTDDVLFVYFYSASSPTPPVGWTTVFDTGASHVYSRPVASNQLATTENFTLSSAAWSAICWAFSGCDLATPVERASPSAGGSSVNPDSPSLTPTWGSATSVWVSIWAALGGTNRSTSAYPANYSVGQATINGTTGGIRYLAGAVRVLSAASEDPGAATCSPSASWLAETYALRPAYL